MPSIAVPLTYEGNGNPVHCPLVAAEVRGVSTLLVVDTGCTDHLLTTALCRRVGFSLTDAPPGVDVEGASVPS